MPKKGQHKNDARDPRKSPGPNNPSKSVTITTGTYKKQETYDEQARAGADPGKPAQEAKREWRPDSREGPQGPGSPRAREGDLAEGDETQRNFPGGSREPESPSNARTMTQSTQGRVLPGEQHPEEWRGDLNPHALDGQNMGPATDEAEKSQRTLYELKDLHRRYSGLSNSDLKQVPVLAPGMRLQQGATYFDLNDVGQGEITATGDMTAGTDNAYVPKSEVDYDLWNRLIGVDDPARLPVR